MANCTSLSCGEYRVVFTNRCGTASVCSLEKNISDLDWGRVMDDTSEANVTINISGGDADGPACCECLGQLRAWVHSMAIIRSGELVWGPGPIMNDVNSTATGKIRALDVSIWLDKRVIRQGFSFKGVDIVEIARQLIVHGMEPDDPCDLVGQMDVTLGGVKIDKTIEANRSYVGEVLRDLAKIGLDYTVIGSTIVLAPNLAYGPFGTLRDEDFLVDVEIEERGEETATKWYVNGGSVHGTAGGTDPAYGLIEQIADGDDNIEDTTAANAAAAGRLTATNPTPQYVNIPDGARISPDSHVCIEQLVPGALFDVSLKNLCREVFLHNRLTALKVTVSGGDESVGVTLAPLGITASEGTGEVGG